MGKPPTDKTPRAVSMACSMACAALGVWCMLQPDKAANVSRLLAPSAPSLDIAGLGGLTMAGLGCLVAAFRLTVAARICAIGLGMATVAALWRGQVLTSLGDAINEAALLVVMAVAVVLLSGQDSRVRRGIAGMVLGVLIGAWGGVGLCGAVVGLGSSGAGDWSVLAPPVAVGAVLLSVSMCAAAWRPARSIAARTRWLPAIVGILTSAATICLWQGLEAQEQRQSARILQTEAQSVCNSISLSIEERVKSLSRMAHRWEVRRGLPWREWREDVDRFLADYPGYQAIYWVDEFDIVQWVAPVEGNEGAQDMDLSMQQDLYAALVTARYQRGASVSRTFPLPQGGVGLLVAVPIFYEDLFGGFIAGVFKVPELFDAILSQFTREVAIAVLDGSTLMYVRRPARPVSLRWPVTARLPLSGTPWDIRVLPTERWLAMAQSPLPEVTLLVGLCVAALFSLVTSLAQTARRRAAQLSRANDELRARQATEVRFSALVRQMSSGVLAISDDGAVAFCNEAAANLLSQSVEGLQGAPVADIIDEDRWHRFFGDMLAAEETTHAGELPVTTPAGVRHLQVAAEAVYLPGEGRLGFVCVLTDVTEFRELDKMKSELIGFVSHELRSPLTGIKLGARTLLSADMDKHREIYAQVLRRIDTEADRLNRMISAFLDLTRIETGRPLQLELTAIDPVELAEEAVEIQRAASANCRFTVEGNGAPPAIRGDRDKLLQVLINLLSNADKYSPSGGEVRVRLATEDSVVRFDVIDQGLGIPPDHLSSLFNAYHRVRDDKRSRIHGTGLGLYLSKHLVEAHGGRIGVESQPDHGSRFFFTVPVSAPGQEG